MYRLRFLITHNNIVIGVMIMDQKAILDEIAKATANISTYAIVDSLNYSNGVVAQIIFKYTTQSVTAFVHYYGKLPVKGVAKGLGMDLRPMAVEKAADAFLKIAVDFEPCSTDASEVIGDREGRFWTALAAELETAPFEHVLRKHGFDVYQIC